MGRPSKLTDAQWESLSEQEWRCLAQKFVESRDDEACIAGLLRLHCIFGHIQRMLRTSKIERYRFEFSVPCGRVDLVLFHSDGGISLVEAKGRNSVRDVVGGIGQLFLYESAIRSMFPSVGYVNRYLISPIQGGAAASVERACALAGVNFIQYAPMSAIEKARDGARMQWCAHG